MFTFKKEHSYFQKLKSEPEETLVLTTKEEGLDEVLLAFERFLQGCGYILEGRLELVHDEISDFKPLSDDGSGNVQDDDVIWNQTPSDWPFPSNKAP